MAMTKKTEMRQRLGIQPGLFVHCCILIRSFNCIFVVRVLLFGASKTGNPLTVQGEILQTILVKSAPDLFRIKSCTRVLVFAVWTSFPVFTYGDLDLEHTAWRRRIRSLYRSSCRTFGLTTRRPGSQQLKAPFDCGASPMKINLVNFPCSDVFPN